MLVRVSVLVQVREGVRVRGRVATGMCLWIRLDSKSSACGNIDSQSHILWCDAYRKLREGKSLDSDRDIAQYYYKVMLIREKLKLKDGRDD